MLNETASSRDGRLVSRQPIPEEAPENRLLDTIRVIVASVMEIEAVVDDVDASTARLGALHHSPLVARFTGQLRLNSEEAYEKLDAGLKNINHLPLLREENGKHVILVLQGRIDPHPRPWWPNLILFLLTLFSVLMVGVGLALDNVVVTSFQQYLRLMISNWSLGLPYAISIMLILGGHELGHYFAARRHNLAVTLPYFIPLPFLSPFGTLGAFIQLRQPMRNRKMLFDVGASGPLVGLAFAIPILFIGLAHAEVGPPIPGGLYEGDSLLYAFAKTVTFGRFLPSGGLDVYVDSSQLAWAGWTGLLVSALNLIPVGQLDGGHILYSLLGDRARLLYYPLMGVMILLALLANVWVLWVVLLIIFGRVYATPLDTITPLDKPRRIVGILTMIIFLLIFVPMPLMPNNAPPVSRPSFQSAMLEAVTNVQQLLAQSGAD